ncbi:Inorganic pyrophosphatase [Catenisphaera adipataccumulans]|jgi:inorganic pyrophosphatase|uniref:Inorganic pyrophosphatase n=1 Tax=Catenisphaera adipataccumulans TaxID=700500 RepID=A0A7W8FWP4_9FIRM|nr:Inorganic pyrophosphatase [Catenisphaera adipataccumulans]MBB5183491.1 inorganic pyrophosphatase [Catenisphaera adipataccumulans]
MNEVENNALFWQKLDSLVLSGTLKIEYPKGSAHERYHNLIYPVDYGALSDATSPEAEKVYAYKGSENTNDVTAIAVTTDILDKDCLVRLLIGCTEEESARILEFLNQTEFQKAILVRRVNTVPSWAIND